MTERLLVQNQFILDQHVRAADVSAPGTRIISTNAPLVIAGSGGSGWVEVTYQVFDCRAAVRAQGLSPFPMNMRLREWFGTRTETVADHGADYPGPSDVCP